MAYKLILADETEIDGLEMNGNTLVSQTEVTSDMLNEEALETVRLIETDEEGNDHETVYRYAQTNGVFLKDEGYCFTIWGAGPSEIEIRDLRAENKMLEDAVVELA